MRFALWLMGLAAAAVALALLAGDGQGRLVLLWPPHRLEISANLALLAALLLFALLHGVLRALAAFRALPAQARQWRHRQRERNAHASVLQAIAQLRAGQPLAARQSAHAALAAMQALPGTDAPAHLPQLQALAALAAAESAHALQDRTARAEHWQSAMHTLAPQTPASARAEVQMDWPVQTQPQSAEANTKKLEKPKKPATIGLANATTAALHASLLQHALQCAVQWALDDGDATAAAAALAQLHALHALPAGQGATANTHAQPHWPSNAVPRPAPCAGASTLAARLWHGMGDAPALHALWQSLDEASRQRLDMAAPAAARWLQLGGAPHVALQWLTGVHPPLLDALNAPDTLDAAAGAALADAAAQALHTLAQALAGDEWAALAAAPDAASAAISAVISAASPPHSASTAATAPADPAEETTEAAQAARMHWASILDAHLNSASILDAHLNPAANQNAHADSAPEPAAAFASATALAARPAIAAHLRGMACLGAGDWALARRHLHTAAHALPTAELRHQAWCALAHAAWRQGDSAAATRAWRQAALAQICYTFHS